LGFAGLPFAAGVGEAPRAYFGVWMGPVPGGLTAALLTGIRYASGAVVLQGYSTDPQNQGASGWLTGCLPAGQLDHRVVAARLTDGSRPLVVVGPANTARVEAVFSTGSVVPVPLTEGGGVLDRPGTVTEVRAYDASGA